jgi:hypothetical protein
LGDMTYTIRSGMGFGTFGWSVECWGGSILVHAWPEGRRLRQGQPGHARTYPDIPRCAKLTPRRLLPSQSNVHLASWIWIPHPIGTFNFWNINTRVSMWSTFQIFHIGPHWSRLSRFEVSVRFFLAVLGKNQSIDIDFLASSRHHLI